MNLFMSAVLPALLTMVIAYLLGSVSSSIIFTKLFSHQDIRKMGSGNAGTTNVLRSVGAKAAACTFVFDFVKGVLAVFIGKLLFQYFAAAYPLAGVSTWEFVQYGAYLAGIFCVLGHDFPVFFGFKGGKGVATSLGILLMTNWQLGLICLVFALVLMALTRVVSMGSIAAAILYPVLTLFVGGGHYIVESTGLGNGYFIYSVILAIIVIFNHRENIKRILSGTENKISFNK